MTDCSLIAFVGGGIGAAVAMALDRLVLRARFREVKEMQTMVNRLHKELIAEKATVDEIIATAVRLGITPAHYKKVRCRVGREKA